ncbi:hypothetical protein ACFL4N_00970 [Thermodesulfobacteriota bacterium]
MMKKLSIFGFILFSLCMTHFPAYAEDFDGSKELLCACMRVIECGPDGDCGEVPAEEAGIPDFLRINFVKKTISAPQWGKGQNPSKIENLERIDGKLILQGAEDGIKDVKDGTGWSIVISEETGKMVLTEAGDQFGLVVFGACTPR